MEAQVADLDKQLARAQHERDEYRKLYELTSMELDRTRRHIFGQKAERVDPAQTQLAIDAVIQAMLAVSDEGEPAPSTPNPPDLETGSRGDAMPPSGNPPKPNERKVTPHGRQKLPEHLPVERIEILPPEVTGEMAESLVRIGEEVTEIVERRPACYVRVQIVRPKFAIRGEPQEGIMCAPAPELPIPRCKAGPGMIAHVLVTKYGDFAPLHRQEGISERDGLPLARSTMCNWVCESTNLLESVVDAMVKDAHNAHCIAMDATTVNVQAPQKCHKGYFWALLADQDHVIFRFTMRHEQNGPSEFLRGFKGYVLADAHSVYEKLYRTEEVTEVGCWAHSRRRFFDAIPSDKDRALTGINFISKLYAIDDAVKKKDLPPAARTKERQRLAQPVIQAFRAWLDREELMVLPKSPIGQAISYARNQWIPLTRFLEDGRLRLDNNRTELELRREAIGRKNWLFVGNEDGGKWNAIATSLIASCKLHGIEPWAYLRDVLILLPDWPKSRVLELSPKFWKQTLENTDARKRLDDSVWSRVFRGPSG